VNPDRRPVAGTSKKDRNRSPGNGSHRLDGRGGTLVLAYRAIAMYEQVVIIFINSIHLISAG